MSMINSVTPTMDVATGIVAPATSTQQGQGSDSISAFNKLLFAGTPQGDVRNLPPSQMLVQQAVTTLGVTSVDLGAKVAGVLSQSVNKLANMA